ncbi:MAG: hypothetical protein PHU23_08745 [Dehalococcoidales bacterium]|nr:hypothetical protein [Dehalococcoidales bacterium]
MKKTKEYTSADLVNLLRDKYKVYDITNGNNPAILLEQVANATGFSAGRWIDAAVFEMWPSKGLTRRAFEIKISRGDFLREMNNPSKYQWCRQHFHEFWYVAPKDVIKVEELPEGAGWLYPAGSRLITGRQASHIRNPELNDELLASFLRSAGKEIQNAAKRDKAQILSQDEGYQTALRYEKAVLQFLLQRGNHSYIHPESEGAVIKLLEDATMDKELRQKKLQLEEVSKKLQCDIAELFNFFAAVATKGILSVDEAGNFLIQKWGDQDPVDKDALKAMKKHDYMNKYLQLIENVRAWEKL